MKQTNTTPMHSLTLTTQFSSMVAEGTQVQEAAQATYNALIENGYLAPVGHAGPTKPLTWNVVEFVNNNFLYI